MAKIDSGGRIGLEKRMGFLWVTFPENMAVQDYAGIEDAVAKHLHGSGGQVVLDFINLRVIYSSGISTLVRVEQRISEQGGMVCCVNVNRTIMGIFSSVNLDRIFPIYETDVEFEISKDEVWSARLQERKADFLFIAQAEKGLYRIILSGEMVTGHDLSACRRFSPDPHVRIFIFDLSSLSGIDSSGAGIFMRLLDRIVKQGEAQCRVFGASEAVKQVLQFLGAEQYVTFFNSEKEALKGVLAGR